MAKRYKYNLIKKNRSYEVNEAADIVGVTPQTIRVWHERGLRYLDETRPMMIRGEDLREFVKGLAAPKNPPMALGEFRCVKCQARRMPLGMMADYLPDNDKSGRLAAICPVCDRPLNLFYQASKLPELSKVLDIVVRRMSEA